MINQDLQIDWYREQMPWGKTITEFNLKNLHQPIRMQGQHYDEESGLHYNRFRYYDPAIGRYLTPDPIGLDGGMNYYAYADNDPMMSIDPLGLDAYIDGGNARVYTDMTNGTTTFYDPYGKVEAVYETRNQVSSKSKPGVGGVFQGKFTHCEYPNNRSMGTAKWMTTDRRFRWIHGGGSGLKDPLAPRQGWKPTFGCTRAQNEDVEDLCRRSEEFLKNNPGKSIVYIRGNPLPNDGKPIPKNK